MKPLILIVEDEAPIVTLLRYNLEREGYEVVEHQVPAVPMAKKTRLVPIWLARKSRGAA